MNTLLALAQNGFEWTWKTSLSAGLLVALVVVAQKLLSRWLTPRLRYALSVLILVRLLFPALPPSPLSVENLFRRRVSPVESVSTPFTAAQRILETNPVSSQRLDATPPAPATFPATSPGIAHVSPPLGPGISVRAWISLAWACGFVCLMTLAGWRYRQWTRLVAQGQPVSDAALLALLEGARAEMGVRRPVKMVVVAGLGSPAIFGIWRVCLLLPQSAPGQLSAEELRMVFLHEMAHVRRHDAGLNFLLIAVQFMHWFNPLVWLANHRIRSDYELVCDAMALSRLPAAERPRYGQVLLKLVDGFPAERPFFSGVVPVVGSKHELKRRLIMIKQQRHGSIGAGLATALAVAALACATFTRAQERAAAAAGWTNWNNGQSIGSFYAVAGTAKETVAVGIGGHISTRNNATGVWTIQTNAGSRDFRAIVYANNQYVVVSEGGFIMTSPDGLQWTSRNSPTIRNLMGVFWDGHQYLAGGDGGTILSSPDGIQWTSRNSGSSINFYSFAYSGARYVAVGNDGILISMDSVKWTKPTQQPVSVPFTACTWTGTEFLACGLGLDKSPTIYTSLDGDSWTLRDTTIKASLRAAATVHGAIYIAGDSVIGRSTDGGTTWANIYDNTGGNKLFMGLAFNGEYLIAAGFNHNVWATPVSAGAAAKEIPSTGFDTISRPQVSQHSPGIDAILDTLSRENLDRSCEMISEDYEQYFFPYVPKTIAGGEEDLEQLISTRRFRKVLFQMKELSGKEERERCERLFFDAFETHTNICYAMAKWVTDPSAPENHRSVLGTRMAMAAAMFVAADTAKLDVLAKQFDSLHKWRNEFEPVAKLPDRRFPSNYVSAVEDLVITPDYRFQVNVLRLAALRSGDLRALKQVDEACAAIHMESNTLPMVRWDAQTTVFEVLPDTPLDTRKGVTEYTFYDWSDAIRFHRILFDTWPADDEEKAFIEKLESIVFH